MSDSIIVRVSLDSYDFCHPQEKQTQVYVQIPGVARASWMLPAGRYEGLKDRAWPEVLDVAEEHYTRGWVVSDSVSAAARKAVVEWLRGPANRDEVQAAWELDEARRHPVASKLLAENERLRARVAELESGYVAPSASCTRCYGADAVRFVNQGGATAPCPVCAPATRTVFRASHDSIVMGLYTTAAEARKHCETEMRREYDESTKVSLWWREDEDTVDQPEDGEAELFVHATPRGMSSGRTWRTGYIVTPLDVDSEYDEGADE